MIQFNIKPGNINKNSTPLFPIYVEIKVTLGYYESGYKVHDIREYMLCEVFFRQQCLGGTGKTTSHINM